MESIRKILKRNEFLYIICRNIYRAFRNSIYYIYYAAINLKFYLKFYFIKFGIIKEDMRYSKIKSFKNKYKGKRCFIIAPGPSLTTQDLEKLEQEYTFACNSIIDIFSKTNFRPSFYGIQDFLAFKILKEELLRSHIKNIFIGIDNLGTESFSIAESETKEFKNSVLYRLNVSYYWFAMRFWHNKRKIKFSKDCYKEIFDGHTIMYSLIQLAVYMGFNKIYLLGADCDYTGKKKYVGQCHWQHDENFDFQSIGKGLIECYVFAKRYSKKQNFTIYNATRGGKLELFERKDLDEVLRESREEKEE